MSSEDPHELVRLAAAANPFQAHIWQQALEDEGIRSQVLGDYLDAGIGDIPGIRAEVWVAVADLARAEAFLRQHRASPKRPLRRNTKQRILVHEPAQATLGEPRRTPAPNV